MPIRDTAVVESSRSLAGKKIDFVVSGGIAAIESPRFVRSLRRLGASVRVWMTKQASEFVSPLVFEWASDQEVIVHLTGSAEHIASSDAIVVSPCGLNTLSKLSLGIADSAALTLCQSALGRIPVVLQTAMHDSMDENSIYRKNKESFLQNPMIFEIPARKEEGKQKVIEPESSADFVSNCVLSNQLNALVLMGPTRSYIDDVRFVSNHSTGRLGSEISNESFRQGFRVDVISGPTEVKPSDLLDVHRVETSTEMLDSAKHLQSNRQYQFIVFAAAVLDFEVGQKMTGKSSSKERLQVQLEPAEKIMKSLQCPSSVSVGFKLESGLSEEQLKERVLVWLKGSDYKLDFVVANLLTAAKSKLHRALLFDTESRQFDDIDSHQKIAQALVSKSLAKIKKG